jgi:hypothetical protein
VAELDDVMLSVIVKMNAPTAVGSSALLGVYSDKIIMLRHDALLRTQSKSLIITHHLLTA